MRFLASIRQRLKGITDAFERYPLAIAFLVATAVLISIEIHTGNDYLKYQLACEVGALLSIVLQAAHERFFIKMTIRFLFMGAGAALTEAYYLLINAAPKFEMEIVIKTSVALFALMIAYIYMPSVRSRISFNESFMAAFKALFQAVFFAAVLFAGCAMIIGAIDTLIVDLDPDWYSHTANIVFVLFAPIFFFSMIPRYPGKWEDTANKDTVEKQSASVQKAARSPRFLDILVSYIIIPIAAVFTVILVIYILINIGGKFWTDNLLEPMLVSYAVGIILLTILSGGMESKTARFFRSVFPKVLIPIVLFQIAASILSLGDIGLTHTRYYVILFGLFAAISGILLSLDPIRKTGLIAVMLIACAIISIVPPIDAFTLSRTSQTKRLESVLDRNGMLDGDTIVPNAFVSDEDKEAIITSVEYLFNMGYAKETACLPEDFDFYSDFNDTFGFDAYASPGGINRSVYVALDPAVPFDIEGYDVMSMASISWTEDTTTDGIKPEISNIQRGGMSYTLTEDSSQQRRDIVLWDADGAELIRFGTDAILDWLNRQAVDNENMPQEETSFSVQNETVRMAVVVTRANMERIGREAYCYAELIILIDFI